MNTLKMLFVLSILLFLAMPGYARDTSSGCGIGWEVNDDHSFVGTSTRGTTHSTFNPSFSMTSGTSGCKRHSLVERDLRGIQYVAANFLSLMVDMSQGQGDSLSAFATLLGCNSVQETFGQVMQDNLSEIYPVKAFTPEEMYWKVVRKIQGHDLLAQSCVAA